MNNFDWDRVQEFWDNHQATILETTISIVAVVVLLIIVQLVLSRLIRRLIYGVVARAERTKRQDSVVVKRRADTMSSTITWALDIVLVLLGAALIFSELGFNVTAVVAGLGVIGLGLGLGAQTLVKDVVNGVFILIEDQYGVGDVVGVAGVVGVVEEINPRRTVVRDLDGVVHIVPNSAIVVASNYTSDFSRINLDIGVAYEEDINRVIEVINEVCEGLAQDLPGDIVSPPSVLRVNDLGDSGVIIKILGDVRIGTQWSMMGELRRRLKVRFDEEGIEIPYPQRALVTKEREPEIRAWRKERLTAGQTSSQLRLRPTPAPLIRRLRLSDASHPAVGTEELTD
ncbi:MAG: mechanosensitive ion channel family protein [Dehalococcoidia bacterium]|nr:mechanosensitive ion channel family protein [Dehalococcoidia bacterium]